MKKLLLLSTLIILFSCSPQKRLSILLKYHPELIQTDTVFKSDTTVVNGVIYDTTFVSQIITDTITIVDKQLTIKYFNDGKKTYIKGVCDTVFVIKNIPVTVYKTEAVISDKRHWYDIPLMVATVVLFVLLIVVIRR